MSLSLAEQLADTIRAEPEPQFPKACGCGRSHDADAWANLHLVGRQPDGAGGVLELRDCACHSTIAIEVER